MTIRIPHTDSPTETRQAFQALAAQTDVVSTGTLNYILVGQGVGVIPVWQTIVSTIDHGSIGGLDGDDHAQYHNDARGDIRYYTKTLLNAGQLDTLYFGEDEFLASSAGAGDAGKPVILDAAGHIDATMVNDGDIDHGSIGGRDDDDHTLYSLVDGTRAFTGVVGGIDPTSATHLATKEYVDQVINFQYRYYFNNTASDIVTYFKAESEPTGDGSSDFTTAGLGTGAAQALTEWATDPGEPGAELLEHGIYSLHIHAAVTGTKPTRIFFRLYKRTHPAGAETLLASSEYSDYITTGVGVDIHATLASDAVILATDRLVWKLLANVEATGSNVDVILYAEGDSSTHVDLPTSGEVLSTIFLRQDGTKDLTGNMLVDAGILIDGRDISVDGAKLDGIEALADKTDATNVTAAGAAMAGGAFHDGFSDFVGAEHVSLPNTITNVLSDHNLAAHTGLGLFDSSGDVDHDATANTHNLNTDLDFDGLAAATPIVAADTIPFHDETAVGNRKVTFANFESSLSHNSLGGYDANDHIDHTGVSITTAAGSGLSGGGDISSTRTLVLNINGLTGESGIVAADTIPFYDDGVGNRKITLTELATALGAADEKVKVDVGATAGYLGVAAGDGVLRTNGTIAWTDGGNFVTLALSHLGIESLTNPGADRILFWDNGATATAWLTVGDGNTLSGTTLTGGHTTRCRAYPASDQDIVDSTFTKVTLGTEDFDSDGDFATSTFTAPADGYYLVSGAARTSELMGPGKSFVVLLYKDGASFSRAVFVNYDGAGSYFLGGVVTDIIYLAATETAELYVWHNHGANRTIDSDPFTFFTVHRLS